MPDDKETTTGPVEVLLGDGVWHRVVPGTWSESEIGYQFHEVLAGEREIRVRVEVPHVGVQAFRSRV